jgi:anti-sigma factor RsiW
MNCNEARQHVMLYLDSEGDPELHFRLSDHLAMCPDCATWFGKQQRLEQALKERLAAGPASAGLWDRVLARSGVAVPAEARRRWLVFGSVVAAACVLLAVALYTSGGRHSSELAGIATGWHERWAAGAVTPDLVSASDEQVESYLKGQVPFRVHCPPRKDVNFAVAGAGVRMMKDRPAAFIVGKVDERPVSIFVLARQSLDAFPHDRAHLAQGGGRHRCRERSYQMVSGVTADNVVVVIGAASAETLEKVLNAYGSYHDVGS